MDILNLDCCIKETKVTIDLKAITLRQWFTNKKKDKNIKNKLMREFRRHALMRKNVFHIYYKDVEWNAVAREKNITDTTIANIQVDMELYSEGAAFTTDRCNMIQLTLFSEPVSR